MYPGYIIPPLPGKLEKNQEPAHIKKKRRFLQTFLNDVLKHPILRSSTLLFMFLSISGEKEYENKKKIYNKLPTPKYVTDCRTVSGTARVSFDESLQKYCSALSRGVTTLQDAFNE